MTNGEFAILSLIVEKPRHGYEIEGVIEQRGMREWTEIGFSSIYYLLKKLEADGLVHSRLESAYKPARKVYSITPEGEAAWRTGTYRALSEPERCSHPIQVGLSNLPGLAPEKALEALRQYLDRLEERQQHITRRWESQKPTPYFVEAMFEHSLVLIAGEIGWARKWVHQLEEQNG